MASSKSAVKSSVKPTRMKTVAGKIPPAKSELAKPELIKTTVVKFAGFKAGDKVVYPGHGVGMVDEVVIRNVGDSKLEFYALTINETGLKVMIPCMQAQGVGLRKVVDKKSVDKIYAILKTKKKKIDTQTWNRRFREYSQKIQTGSLYEIAEVLRDLSALRCDKELSFGEKQMYEKAESRLISEIAVSRAKPIDKVKVELDTMLS